MTKTYLYEVARIRRHEMNLLTGQALAALAGAFHYEDCLRMLRDRGWGDGGESQSAEDMLAAEEEKTWALMKELLGDLSLFDAILIPYDFHNLKAFIKLRFTGEGERRMILPHGTVDPALIRDAVAGRDFAKLPERMRKAADEAYEILFRTGDGGACDAVLDRAALESILRAGEASPCDVIRRYAELTVAAADIKVAVRCHRTGKDEAFLRSSLVPCASIDAQELARAAGEGIDAIAAYLQKTPYRDAAEALARSPAAFERWCDDLMIRAIQKEQYNAFGPGPLAAYVLGRQNEIKSVRILLSGKLNRLPDEVIRERLREMYV